MTSRRPIASFLRALGIRQNTCRLWRIPFLRSNILEIRVRMSRQPYGEISREINAFQRGVHPTIRFLPPQKQWAGSWRRITQTVQQIFQVFVTTHFVSCQRYSDCRPSHLFLRVRPAFIIHLNYPHFASSARPWPSPRRCYFYRSLFTSILQCIKDHSALILGSSDAKAPERSSATSDGRRYLIP